MTRVPKITRPSDIAAPQLGDQPERSRLPVWVRVVLEFFGNAVSAIF